MQRRNSKDKTRDDQSSSRRSSYSGSSTNASKRNSVKRREKPSNPRSPSPTPSFINTQSSCSLYSSPKKTFQHQEHLKSSGSYSPTISEGDFLISGTPAPRKTDRAMSLPTAYPSRHHYGAPKKIKNPKINLESPTVIQKPKKHIRHQTFDCEVALNHNSASETQIQKAKVPRAFSRKKSVEKDYESSVLSIAKTNKTRRTSSQTLNTSRTSELATSDTNKTATKPLSRSKDSISRRSYYGPRRTSFPLNSERTEFDYSSVSPDYTSEQSSNELSPETSFKEAMMLSMSNSSMFQSDVAVVSPLSHKSELTDRTQVTSSSSCYMSWIETNSYDELEHPTRTPMNSKTPNLTIDGEWNHFWANYNNSLSQVPTKQYDQCPTPYYTEEQNVAVSETLKSEKALKKLSEDFSRTQICTKEDCENIETLNKLIKKDGISLTAEETKDVIQCAHTLATVLSNAIERSNEEERPEKEKESELVKKNIELKTTQTDISLPNTQSAPRIFENILRELSKTSRDGSFDLDQC